MRRSALLIMTGLTLVCFSGCHFHWWHHKHHKDYDYASYDACGCDTGYAGGGYAGGYAGTGDLSPIPLSHTIASTPVRGFRTAGDCVSCTAGNQGRDADQQMTSCPPRPAAAGVFVLGGAIPVRPGLVGMGLEQVADVCRLPARDLFQDRFERGFLGFPRNHAKLLRHRAQILGRQLVQLLDLGRDQLVSHLVRRRPFVKRRDEGLGVGERDCRHLRLRRPRCPGRLRLNRQDASLRIFLGPHQEAREILDLMLGKRLETVARSLEIVEDLLLIAGRCQRGRKRL